MLKVVAIARDNADRRYNDLLDVVEDLGSGICGTYRNALLTMCQTSTMYQETLARLRKKRGHPAAKRAAEAGSQP